VKRRRARHRSVYAVLRPLGERFRMFERSGFERLLPRPAARGEDRSVRGSTPLPVVRRRASPAWTPGQSRALACCGCHLLSVVGGDCGACGAPSLTWVHGPGGSGDKMIDRVWFPTELLAAALSLMAVQAGGGWRLGVWGSRSQSILVTRALRVLGCWRDQAAAGSASFAACSIGASACSPSSRRVWWARRQSLRATERQARVWPSRWATWR
jgi:hypothetical protein